MPADFDLAVIGAGIHGAAVAQAAAAAGWGVAVLEQTGVASGTSSRSSKLIHGGLRYLETGQWTLVRECLQERTGLLRRAPGLVRLVPHHIPVYAETRRRPWQLRLGLSLYGLLGRGAPGTGFRRLPPSAWGGLDGLRTAGLQAVFRYHDAQTDDAALTRAVLNSALSLGAGLTMPACVTGADWNGTVWTLRYRDGGGEASLRCRALVNAAGPWVAAVRAALLPAAPPQPAELVQGAHIELSGRLTAGVYYVEAPADGRAVFVMPRGDGRILVGTTETPYAGDPAAVAPLPAEVDYLRITAGHYFPDLAAAPVETAYAGLRVLPAGGDPFRRRRDTRLIADREGRLISIYGGKLTAHRITAERVVAQLAPLLPARRRVADTRTLPLPVAAQ